MIANRYRIDAEIGKGGMGTVYKGLDMQTRQMVAIKHLKPELIAPELIERFKREGEALRELNHPNIVKMLTAVEENGAYYLIMEYLAGGDLNDLLKTSRLSVEKVLQIAIDISDALTRAHRLNIIHRDLKPANVLMAADGTPRLSDFGVAHFGHKGRVTDTDALVGTVDYMAPEMLTGATVDTQTDIWAFGVMLFEMLAGKRPFTGQIAAQILMAIMTQPTPDLERLCPAAPIALVDLVYRMLEKDPHVRIASVRHVGAELEDILQGRSSSEQQAHDTTRFATPTPDFLHRPRHNLPAQTTPFVGREAELSELAKLLDNPKIRLMTIVAQGGMGKTRLALELAEKYVDNNVRAQRAAPLQTIFSNGVYFVELAPLSDHNNITSAVADATGYQFQSDGRDEKQQILDFLSNKNMLLLMDNYEHLLEGAPLVTDILKAAPNAKILATSRQRLNQSGETVFNLQGMNFPTWETPDDALEYAAVKLFLQGATRAQPDFEVTVDNMDGIARICKLVQGMPLGILLAASWVMMLSPHEIAAEVTQSIDFLTSELSDMSERQRSMRAVFDYSWDLLTDDEKQVFMKLSVFRGGFTREAAEVVAGANLRTLMSLINKSLLRRDVNSGRYDIHELLRQYGEAQLLEYGELASTQNNHATYFANFMSQQWPVLKSHHQVGALNAIDRDYENVQIAWFHLVNMGRVVELREFASSLSLFAELHLSIQQGYELFTQAREKLQSLPDNELRNICLGHIIGRQAWFLSAIGQHENGKQAAIEGVAILQKYNYHEETIMAFESLISIDYILGNYDDLQKTVEQGLKLNEFSNNQWGMVRHLYWLGMSYLRRDDSENALQIGNRCLNILGQTGDIWMAACVSGLLMSWVAITQKNYSDARQSLKQGLNVYVSFNHFWGIGTCYSNLGEIAYLENDYHEANRYYQQAIQYRLASHSIWQLLSTLVGWSRILVNLDGISASVALLHCILKYKQRPDSQDDTSKLLISLKNQLDTETYEEARQRGQILDIETLTKELLIEFGENRA